MRALELGQALLPAMAYLVVAPPLWFLFRGTWRELDREAHVRRGEALARGTYDRRPAILFALLALGLTLQEYYGGREFFLRHLLPSLQGATEPSGHLQRYRDLYGYAWWSLSRLLTYVALPLGAWKLFFRKDRVLDLGLRFRGLNGQGWLYALCLGLVLPLVFLVARAPDFGAYYPFYKLASRSWFDLLAWEALYAVQFFALEVLFRGIGLEALRPSLGSSAIFALCVPYCMIHFGKPYLEAAGALIAGVALGSLSMRTRSIYPGLVVHLAVALTMDLTALAGRHALPTKPWP